MLSAPRPARALTALRQADRAVGLAERAFSRHQYADALSWSLLAYRQARIGAAAAGVDVDRSDAQAKRAQAPARQAESAHQPGEFIDTLDGPRGAP